MEIGKQIKKYRTEQSLSQDDLADKIYVTRQTISNWENNRNYPDIRSLVLLSNVFGVSLDILVKGDLEQMKEEIKAEDIRKFNRDYRVYIVLMLGMMFLFVPLVKYLGWPGFVLWVILAGTGLWWDSRLEKQLKAYDVYTYKEIVAFMEGKRLDELQKNQEIGKRPYQKFLLCTGAAVIAFLVCLLLDWVLK